MPEWREAAAEYDHQNERDLRRVQSEFARYRALQAIFFFSNLISINNYCNKFCTYYLARFC